MKIIFIIIIANILVLSSCRKEKFPEIEDLTGNWIEQTSNAFKTKIIFEGETMYLYKSSAIDTFSYRLDEKQELIFLSLKNNLFIGESRHKILLNRKSKELTIWGLFVSFNTSETIFKKE
jgi:hypothetical protein